MAATNYLTMDPNILYSLVNMKLRNDFEDLTALARAFELDRAGWSGDSRRQASSIARTATSSDRRQAEPNAG